MGESRTELLAWLNDFLQIKYTRIEQAGTGAAYCQVMDSIFNDVNMPKVKFNTKNEYDYVSNYKILQHTFDKHKIHKIIPVSNLIKCKFQDNLEFMQWIKRYWEQNYTGGEYDAIGRRKGASGPVKKTAGRLTASNVRINDLNQEIDDLRITVDGLEKERDFYFGKLREIEILIQQRLEVEDSEYLEIIQSILYQTEEGFEIPNEDDLY